MSIRAVFHTMTRRRLLGAVLACLFVVGLVAAFVRVRFYGHYEGIYLLKDDRPGIVIADDVILGQESEVLAALPFERLLEVFANERDKAINSESLDYEWFSHDGSGFVRSYFADGTVMLTCLSRFVDSGGGETRGIFVGGGLPFSLRSEGDGSLNETGISFYDTSRWQHLWCNVNESISPGDNPGLIIAPSTWQFLGSRAFKALPGQLALQSSHRVVLDGVPLRLDRFAFFKAGRHYFTLVIRIVNEGARPAGYFYVYGDEPWVGNYGTSAGNVGWLADRLVHYEQSVDPERYGWGGYFDYGNAAAGESPGSGSGTANFIEWQQGVRPNLVYFSNRIGAFAEERARVPLADPANRVIFLQWGPRYLYPGQSDTLVLVIGMADHDPVSGLPVKPATTFDPRDYAPVIPEGFISAACPFRQ